MIYVLGWLCIGLFSAVVLLFLLEAECTKKNAVLAGKLILLGPFAIVAIVGAIIGIGKK